MNELNPDFLEFIRLLEEEQVDYLLHVRWSDEDAAFLGSIPGLIGDCRHADSPEQVLFQLKDIAEDLVTHLMAQGSD